MKQQQKRNMERIFVLVIQTFSNKNHSNQ